MQEEIEVIYENGALRPLEPLPLQEHDRLTITIDTATLSKPRLDKVCLAAAKRDANPMVTIEEVRRILAKVPGTLTEAVIAEREER